MQGLTGTGLRAAISLMNAYEKPKLNEYWQVRNPNITNNIIVNCKEAIEIGSGKDSKRVLAPIGVILENNIVIDPEKLIVYNENLNNDSLKNNKVKGVAIEEGFQTLKLDLFKSSGIYQIKGKEKTPFWLSEHIGPNWKIYTREIKLY